MTSGTKIILSLILIEAILASLIVISSLVPDIASLERLSKITTIIGFIIALGALLIAAAEYYRKKSIDAEESRPYVIATLEPKIASMSIFNLRIENTGKTLARNVSIKFTPDYKPFDHAKSMNELGVLKNIGVMTPNEKREYFFGNYMSPDGDRSIKKEFNIKVSYVDVTGKRNFSEVFVSNPTDYEGMLQSSQKGISDIYQVLSKFLEIHKGSVASQKKLQETITENGIRIRNLNSVGKSKAELLASIVNIYKYPNENEFWLNPFVYDLKLIVRQCRDQILTQDSLSNEEEAIVADLNYIMEKDWHWDEEAVQFHFNNIVKAVADSKASAKER